MHHEHYHTSFTGIVVLALVLVFVLTIGGITIGALSATVSTLQQSVSETNLNIIATTDASKQQEVLNRVISQTPEAQRAQATQVSINQTSTQAAAQATIQHMQVNATQTIEAAQLKQQIEAAQATQASILQDQALHAQMAYATATQIARNNQREAEQAQQARLNSQVDLAQQFLITGCLVLCALLLLTVLLRLLFRKPAQIAFIAPSLHPYQLPTGEEAESVHRNAWNEDDLHGVSRRHSEYISEKLRD